MQACGCTREKAFMAYFLLLAFIHNNGRNGKAHATRKTIDLHTGIPGFATALEGLDWLRFEGTLGTPMRWGWKLRKAYITRRKLAELGLLPSKGISK